MIRRLNSLGLRNSPEDAASAGNHQRSKSLRLAWLVPVLLLLAAQVVQAATDTGDMPDDGFSPMLFAFFVAGVTVMLLLVGLGLVAGLIITLSAGVLVSLGIISSSVCLGLLRRRFSSGLRALHYQAFIALAVPVGITVLWFGSQLWGTHWRLRDVLLIGGLAGAGGGLLLAFLFDWLAGVACRRLTRLPILNRFPLQHSGASPADQASKARDHSPAVPPASI